MAQTARSAPQGGGEDELVFGSREERLFMRQRGAGTRQINNIDFGFAFATPSTVRGSRTGTRSNTPQSVALPSRRGTPLGDENAPGLPSSIRTIKNSHVDKMPASASGRARKRRRLSDVSNLQHISSPRMSDAILRSIIQEEMQNGAPQSSSRRSHVLTGSEQIQQRASSSPLFFPETYETVEQSEEEHDEEQPTTGPSTAKKSAKRRKRKSVGQQSLFKKKRKSSSIVPLPTPSDTQEDSYHSLRRISVPPIPAQSRVQRWSVASSEQDLPLETIDSIEARTGPQTRESSVSNSVRPKKRKRKSVVLGKTKRKSSVPPVPTPSQIVQSIEIDESTAPTEEMSDIDKPNELSLDLAPVPPHSISRKFVSHRQSRSVVEDSDEDAPYELDDQDQTYLTNESVEPTPAAKHKKTVRRQYPSNRPRESTARQKSSYPILTHRLTNTTALPTIEEEPEDDAHVTPRTAPNAADVVSQTAREVVDAEMFKLKSSGLSKAEMNRRLSALTAFRDTLDERFFELSQTLDQRSNVEARLRKSRREKTALQNEWLELRRQRDLLDLKKDAIRRQHWENEVLARKRFDASQAAYGLDTAGDEEVGEFDGLEFEIHKTAWNLSSASGGGILNTVKGFNATLESLLEELG